jgi:uncharacterized lipoprotein YajG
METNARSRRILLVGLLAGLFLATACVTQHIDLRNVEQAASSSGGRLRRFEKSGYSFYVLLDLIPVKDAQVENLLKKVNPDGKPVLNLKITSSEDIVATLVNLLNGGIIDRGIIFSLNKVTVEGDVVE